MCAQPTSLLDLFPTLIELCGLPVVADQAMDGVSLVPWLLYPAKHRTRNAVTVHELQHMSVRSNQYRYIRYIDGSEELYDLWGDPNEWDNLIGDPSFEPIRKDLSAELPTQFAPSAKSYTQFEFDPRPYTWTDKKTGAVVSGSR